MRLTIGLLLLTGLQGCDDVQMEAPDLGTLDMTQPDLAGADLTVLGCITMPPAEMTGCMPLATDYTPRVSGSSTDQWAACISDDNTFHQLGASMPSTVARTNAWDAIGNLLWRRPGAPPPADFLAARDAYSVAQGIGSRVDRRQDIHYPTIPGTPSATACSNAGVPAMYPDRCAGPALLGPIINDAFQKGLAGTQPRVQAARLEAALLWFFYLSTVSEVWTCSFDKKDDCDSALAYYNAFTPRGEVPQGIARYFKELSPESHERSFDGFLAERCWRDLDQALPAGNLPLYERASKQIDRAELYGLARLLISRLVRVTCTSGEEQEVHVAFVKLLGGFMDRATRELDATRADALKAALAAPTVDARGAIDALTAVYTCP
jgi:hypothetical protein